MKVIIPAAGFGSRLRPHTYLTPKVLLPVAGKPILEYIVDQAISYGGNKFTVICGYLGEQIANFFEKRYHIKADCRYQEQQLGLGHAVRMGIDPDDESLLVILGDTIVETDVLPVIRKGNSAIAVKEVADPTRFGVVELENGKIVRLVEKPREPKSNLAIVGVYYFNNAQILAKAIDTIIETNKTVKGEFQITDALQLMIEWGEAIETFPVEGWFDCGKPETLLQTNKYLLERDGGEVKTNFLDSTIIIPPVFIGENTTIERAIIGPFVSIGTDSIIRDAYIKDSIIGDRVLIDQVLLDQSLIGSRAEVRHQFQQINIGASSWIRL